MPLVPPSDGFSSYGLPTDAPPRFEGLPSLGRGLVYGEAPLTLPNVPTFMPALSLPASDGFRSGLPPLRPLRPLSLPGAVGAAFGVGAGKPPALPPPPSPVRPPGVVVGKPGAALRTPPPLNPRPGGLNGRIGGPQQ